MSIAESNIRLGVGISLGLMEAEWRNYTTRLRIEVRLIPEDEGGFSVYAVRLPGACSQGETVAEAIANIQDAVAGLIEQYEADGVKIPWLPDAETPEPSSEEIRRWIAIDAKE